MLLNLHLKNFQKHRDLRLDFGSGLHLLKGANEAGKSTLMRAVVYALFGSRSLPLPLSEYVTWGVLESQMAVALAFRYDSMDYSIRRSKSGAEMQADDLRVSGQAEVTAFVERLFGVNAVLAGKLMLAQQSTLQGALSDGSAVNLIETLADFDLLETIIDKIQTHYPTGNTAALEQQIAAAPTEKPEAPDLTERQARLAELGRLRMDLSRNILVLEQELADLDVEAAKRVLTDQQNLQWRLADMDKRLAGPKLVLARPEVAKPAVTLEDSTATEQDREQAAKRHRDYQTVREWDAKLRDGYLWTSTSDALELADARVADWKARLSTERSRLQQWQVAHGVALAKAVEGGVCEWCNKDLSDVPAVASRNVAAAQEVQDAKDHIESSAQKIESLQARLDETQQAVRLSREALAAVRLIPALNIWEFYLPIRISWEGQVPELPTAPAVDLKQLARDWDAYNRDAAERVAAWEQTSSLLSQLAETREALDALPVVDAEETLVEEKSLREQRGLRQLDQMQVEAEETSIHTALEVAIARHSEALKHWEAAQAQIEQLRQTLATTKFNNSVVKRVREARPEVAARLWAVVLQSVSQVFSAVRGTPSTVTRQGSDFLVDGHSAKSLSGSTLDSLGLAIRIGLVKTFLPNVRFLLVDEPAAGMDKDREAAMLAMLSGCDLEQVIMITHSSLADSFANNITEL